MLRDAWIIYEGSPAKPLFVLVCMNVAIAFVTYNSLARLAPVTTVLVTRAEFFRQAKSSPQRSVAIFFAKSLTHPQSRRSLTENQTLVSSALSSRVPGPLARRK